MATLNPKRLAFAREYVVDCNGAAAAIRAGYAPRTARTVGSQLLAISDVRAEVTRLQALAERAAVMDLTEACERMTVIARGPDDEAAIRAVARLAKLLNWDAPTKIAPVTPDGLQPYQAALSPDAAAVFYLEAMQRAVQAQPPK